MQHALKNIFLFWKVANNKAKISICDCVEDRTTETRGSNFFLSSKAWFSLATQAQAQA